MAGLRFFFFFYFFLVERFSRVFFGGVAGEDETGQRALCKGVAVGGRGSLRIRCKYVFDSFHSLGVPFCLWIFILSLIFGNNPWHGGARGCPEQQGVLGGMKRV